MKTVENGRHPFRHGSLNFPLPVEKLWKTEVSFPQSIYTYLSFSTIFMGFSTGIPHSFPQTLRESYGCFSMIIYIT